MQEMRVSIMNVFTLFLISTLCISHGMLFKCRPGQFLQDGECNLCPLGTFQDKVNATSCTPCPRGTYNPYLGAEGLDVCVECPAGTFQDTPGATSKRDCEKCPVGKSSLASSPNCISCPAGEFISGCEVDENDFPLIFRGNCLTCQGGNIAAFCTHKGPVELTCMKCYPGQISGKSNSLECEFCPEGMIAAEDATRCLSEDENKCPPGTERSSSLCTKCNSFYFNDGTQKNCNPCPLGFIGESRKGSKKCVPCPSGTFKNDKYERCKKCKEGYNNLVTGAQYCTLDNTPCPPNFFRNSNGACLKCTEHERYDKTQNKCVRCPKNSLSKGALSTTCIECPRGMVTMEDYARCICKEGWGFVEGSNGTRCRKCLPGTEGSTGTSICSKCYTDTFAPKPGMTSCIGCPEGFSQPLMGQTKCIRDSPCPKKLIKDPFGKCVEPRTNCPPNNKRIPQDFDLPICEPKSCPLGTALIYDDFQFFKTCMTCSTSRRYDPQEQTCEDCNYREVSKGGLSKDCQRCPKRMEAYDGICRCINGNRLKNGKCVRCPKGTWGFNHIDGCLPCPAGTFSDDVSLEACSNCKSGFFTDETGQVECKRCPKGLISFGIGDTGCVRSGSSSA